MCNEEKSTNFCLEKQLCSVYIFLWLGPFTIPVRVQELPMLLQNLKSILKECQKHTSHRRTDTRIDRHIYIDSEFSYRSRRCMYYVRLLKLRFVGCTHYDKWAYTHSSVVGIQIVCWISTSYLVTYNSP